MSPEEDLLLQMQGMIARYRGLFAEDERAQREAYDLVVQLQGRDVMVSVWQRAVWTLSLVGAGRAEDAWR